MTPCFIAWLDANSRRTRHAARCTLRALRIAHDGRTDLQQLGQFRVQLLRPDSSNPPVRAVLLPDAIGRLGRTPHPKHAGSDEVRFARRQFIDGQCPQGVNEGAGPCMAASPLTDVAGDKRHPPEPVSA